MCVCVCVIRYDYHTNYGELNKHFTNLILFSFFLVKNLSFLV